MFNFNFVCKSLGLDIKPHQIKTNNVKKTIELHDFRMNQIMFCEFDLDKSTCSGYINYSYIQDGYSIKKIDLKFPFKKIDDYLAIYKIFEDKNKQYKIKPSLRFLFNYIDNNAFNLNFYIINEKPYIPHLLNQFTSNLFHDIDIVLDSYGIVYNDDCNIRDFIEVILMVNI